MANQPAKFEYDDLDQHEVDEIKQRLWTKWEHVAGDLSVVGGDMPSSYSGADVAAIIVDLVAYTDLSELSWSNTPTRWASLSREAQHRLLNEVFPTEVHHSYH